MFAAVLLGGLGTAYGAMVGGLVIGVVTEVGTFWISSKYKLGVALVGRSRPCSSTTRPARPSRTGRVTSRGLRRHLRRRLPRTALGPVAAVYAVAAIGLNLHSASRVDFGHVAFLFAARRHGDHRRSGRTVVARVSSGSRPAVVLGSSSDCRDVAPRSHTSPSSRSRLARCCGSWCAALVRSRCTGGVSDFNGSPTAFPSDPFEGGRFGWGWFSYTTRRPVGDGARVADGRHLHVPGPASHARVPGSRAPAIREDEDAARSLGKNVFAFSSRPDYRWSGSVARRHAPRHRSSGCSPRHVPAPSSRSPSTRSHDPRWHRLHASGPFLGR